VSHEWREGPGSHHIDTPPVAIVAIAAVPMKTAINHPGIWADLPFTHLPMISLLLDRRMITNGRVAAATLLLDATKIRNLIGFTSSRLKIVPSIAPTATRP
jgi:hypothetical protein